jgi:hypothetical protein
VVKLKTKLWDVVKIECLHNNVSYDSLKLFYAAVANYEISIIDDLLKFSDEDLNELAMELHDNEDQRSFQYGEYSNENQTYRKRKKMVMFFDIRSKNLKLKNNPFSRQEDGSRTLRYGYYLNITLMGRYCSNGNIRKRMIVAREAIADMKL